MSPGPGVWAVMGGEVSSWDRDGFCSGLSSQQDGPAQQRVPLLALKVSSGTFQFDLSPPLVLPGGIGEFGRVQPLQLFLLTLPLLFFSHSSSEKRKS